MKYLVFLDDGHGLETRGKRTPYMSNLGRSVRENEFNGPVVEKMEEMLNKYEDVTVYLTAPGHNDVPLNKRTDYANEVYRRYQYEHGKENVIAIFISVHYNAFDGSFSGKDPHGHEIHVYPGYLNKEAGKLADFVAKYLRQGTTQNWRGILESDFHVLRETSMTAILSENGFMDNEREANLMLDESFQYEVAEEHVKGIVEYFDLSKKDTPKYRLLTGTFKEKYHAEKAAEYLRDNLGWTVYVKEDHNG